MPLNLEQVDWQVIEEDFGQTIVVTGRLNIKPYFYITMRADKLQFRGREYQQCLHHEMFKRLAECYAVYEEEYQ